MNISTNQIKTDRLHSEPTTIPPQDNQHPPIAISYGFLVLYLVLLSAFGSFVNDMYIPSLPDMREQFHCSVSVTQLGLTCGMIGLAIGQIVLGPVSDKYGRKIVLVWSLILFTIAAAVSIISPNIHFFNICRLFQGMGASGAYFLARTVPADYYKGRQLAKTMALIGAINGFAPASAPVLGGLCAHSIGWHGIFWILCGFSLILLLISIRFKESLPKARRTQGPLSKAFGEYTILLHNRNFLVHVLLKGCALGVLFAYISSAPFLIQTHYGYTPLQFGLFMGANALLVAIGSMVALKFKILKTAALWGGIILFITTLLQSATLYVVDKFWYFEIGMLPMLFALGMLFTVGNTLAMNEGRAYAGSASAIVGVGGYIFGALVSPLVGMGNIVRSTAIVFTVMATIVLLFSVKSYRLPADLNK